MSESCELSCRFAQLTINRGDVQYEEDAQSFLGRGSYGKVYRGRYHHQDVAVKNLRAIFFELAEQDGQDKVIAQLTKECELLSCLRHDNIVRLYGVVNAGSPQMCMVTELMDGSLDQLYPASPPLTRCEELDIASSVCNALQYLHTYRPRPIIHRDLAPKNILYKEDGERLLVKLTDVGLAKMVKISRSTSLVAASHSPGTTAYMPPEALSTHGIPRYGTSLDVFSFGVSMVEVILRNPPSVLETQRTADIEEVRERGHPLHGLLKQCLSDKPSLRPTAAMLVDGMNGLRSQDWYGTMSYEQRTAHKRCSEASGKRLWRNEYYKMMEGRVAQTEAENRELISRQAQLDLSQQHLARSQTKTDKPEKQLEDVKRQADELLLQKQREERRRVEVENELSALQMKDAREGSAEGAMPLVDDSDAFTCDDEDEKANKVKNTWQMLPPLPLDVKQECTSVVWRDQLYVAVPTPASQIPHNFDITLCRLSHDKKSWQVLSVPTPPPKISWPAALHVDAKRGLLMQTTFKPSAMASGECDKVWVLDDCNSMWQLLCTVPDIAYSGTALLEDLLICAGGESTVEPSPPSSTVQIFNMQTNKWSTWPDLPCKTAEARLVPLRHETLCLGGKCATSVVAIDQHNPVSWNEHSSSQLLTCHPGVTVRDKDSFIVAGGARQEAYDHTECRLWSNERHDWSELPDLPHPRLVPSLSVHNGHLYSVGGSRRTPYGDTFSREAFYLRL